MLLEREQRWSNLAASRANYAKSNMKNHEQHSNVHLKQLTRAKQNQEYEVQMKRNIVVGIREIKQ